MVQGRQQRGGAVGGCLVHVGAGIQQHFCGFQVVMLCRENQRGHTTRLCGIGAVIVPRNPGHAHGGGYGGVDHPAHGPTLGDQLHVGVMGQQQLGNAFGCPARPHQGGLAELRLARIDVSLVVQEHRHHVRRAGAHRQHQRGFACHAGHARVCAVVQQHLRQPRLAVLDRHHQRGDTAGIGDVGIGARLQRPRRGHVAVAIHDRPGQWRLAGWRPRR